MGFKGGTAAYFFYGLNRFSTDLDFDLLNKQKKDDVEKTVRQILKNYGLISDYKDKKYTLFFLLNYEKGSTNVKVEINKRLYPNYNYSYKNFYGINVLTLEEVDSFSSKLVTATARKKVAMRDFYDILFYLKKGTEPNIQIIEDQTDMSFGKYIEELISYIEANLKENRVLYGLGEVLDKKQKDWIKNNLKKELITQLKFLKDTYT